MLVQVVAAGGLTILLLILRRDRMCGLTWGWRNAVGCGLTSGLGHGCGGSVADAGACARVHCDGVGRGGRLLLQHGPVERVVVLVVERAEQDAEQLAKVHVVGRLFEPQAAAVVQVHGELGGETLENYI